MASSTTQREEIEARLPHPPPFLFVDRILDRFQCAHVATGQDHMRALCSEGLRGRGAYPLARSGDEDGATLKSFIGHQATFPTGSESWR